MSTEVKVKNKEEKEALVKEMFRAGVHYGYSRRQRHPSVSDFIFGYKNRGAIIDIEKTVDDLDRVLDFVRSLARERKQILFIGTKPEARLVVEKMAKQIDMPYVSLRWIGGTLTNFKEIRKRLAKLADWKEKGEKGELAVYTKKERLMISREVEDLERLFGGITGMPKIPSAIFVVDAKKEEIAVAEAKVAKVPVIAIANSDCNITNLEYPLVGNDASGTSIAFFLQQIVLAYKEGLATPAPAPAEKKAEETN
ncbi:MAG: 30S ribosomal protein S2 [Parcubacteria group bacterium GW2011_GWC1_43_11b]|uniref:Small ribosomal subunit protein uS2 n=2 Tax=Candidatus Vogeliibacteriota TaxID=1817922 RepID=A0A1G2QGP1_9BACT|nr:MAG: 30S ribosomal protein S2 [Parcubacteria group bacterium GW2011_GWC1_43_11b]OHA59182.1 MAG: 30S ribosomal protein S2 [Candidatus Vogelbacteria bacterium RIFOXYB1_FULL_42_16]OHA60290.1 MAG: 30S ribosomal protein S2 [Candidatus Vogelbacteria bacterium RIFOXYD1_FULL_42_15]